MNLVTMFLVWVGAILSFSPTLTPEDVQAALTEGQSMVTPDHGYQWQPYLLVSFDNGLDITPEGGEVDAVLVGTSYERVRFQSYLAGYQGTPMTLQQAEAVAQQQRGILEIIVFAHSSSNDASEQPFLTKFSPATLSVSSQSLTAEPQGDPEPASDFFNVQGAGREFRWLGQVVYRFDLSALEKTNVDLSTLKGTLAFSDSAKKSYSLELDLGKYR